MAENKVTRIKIGVPRERTTIDSEGKFILKLEVPYSIGDANYSILILKDGSTAESIEAAVKQDAARIAGIKDKIITV